MGMTARDLWATSRKKGICGLRDLWALENSIYTLTTNQALRAIEPGHFWNYNSLYDRSVCRAKNIVGDISIYTVHKFCSDDRTVRAKKYVP